MGGVWFAFAGDDRKFRAEDEEGPDDGDYTDDEIRTNDAQGFDVAVSVVGVLGLELGDLLGREFDAGKNEDGADERAGDGA